jgi:hypothetical protein
MREMDMGEIEDWGWKKLFCLFLSPTPYPLFPTSWQRRRILELGA